MKPLWSSPCSREGLSPREDPFPCLHDDWGARPCPMNAAQCDRMRRREARMYRLGYGYAAWVVRMDPLGLSPLCSLTYFREPPAAGDLEAMYGKRVLRVWKAEPAPQAGDSGPSLDHEVLADAAG